MKTLTQLTQTDADDAGIDMSDGAVRIQFPSGWEINKNLVRVSAGPEEGTAFL